MNGREMMEKKNDQRYWRRCSKHRAAIASWEKSNPLWTASDRGKDEYIHLVQTVMGDTQEPGNKNKIIKSVAKITILCDDDKKLKDITNY